MGSRRTDLHDPELSSSKRGRDLRLDGIRGLAVLLVLAYHTPTPVRLLPADSRLLPGGWVGVDVFFVLSGYLITHLLIRELRSTGRIDRRAFYGRRLRRLGPALGVLLAVWVLASLTGLLPVLQFPTGAPASAWTLFVPVVGLLTLCFNWVIALDGFVPSPYGPQHLWTLSIEEQFYLVWPAVIVFVAARSRQAERTLGRLVLAAIAYTVLITLVLQYLTALRGLIYASSPTRSLGLLVGAAIAFRAPRKLPRGLGELGLLTILACAVFLRDNRPELTPWMIFATCLASAAILTSHSAWLERVLTLRWLRYAGRRSYALYLWSIPLEYAAVVHLGPTWATTVVVPIATFVLAELSWRVVERRFLSTRSGGRRATRQPVLQPAPTA
ncbi:MAG: hypothetical protein QOH95_1558 [Gaiellaceae bacterium]|nr:hypothetical protein [Gaiellaceae bacterium]